MCKKMPDGTKKNERRIAEKINLAGKERSIQRVETVKSELRDDSVLLCALWLAIASKRELASYWLASKKRFLCVGVWN